MRYAGPLLAALLLAACAGGSPQASSGPTSSASVGSPAPTAAAGPLLEGVVAEPVERAEAGIAAAFDPQAAGELVAEVPPGLDFEHHALICVYLGERPTAGWDLSLQSASIVDGELRILARETFPRTEGEPQTTYPGACGALSRAALPEGMLPVRADDTIHDEFITDGTLVVPALSGAP